MAAGFGSGLAALIRVAEECVLDIEVALVRRNLHRLAHAAAREMDGRRHVREFDEVGQILERTVAAPALDVAHERRTADRREHRGIAAEADVTLGIAGEQREFLGGRGEQGSRQAARYPHALALHVRTSAPPQLQRLRIAPELDPDLLEDRLRIRLDDLDRIKAQELDRLQPAADVGVLERDRLRPGATAVAAAPRGSAGVAHRLGHVIPNITRRPPERAAPTLDTQLS